MNRNGEAQQDLAALRRAVYARDAPPDAAEDYATALAAAGTRVSFPAREAVRSPALEPAVGATRRHHRWAAVGAATGVAATLVLGAVLAGRVGGPPVPHASPSVILAGPAAAAAASVPTTTPLPDIVPPPVPGPVLASFTSTRGAVAAQLDAGRRHVLLTAVCGGDGTVSIRLSDGSNTILTCSPGQDALSMVASEHALGRFTVTTSTTGHPLWAMTVGIVLSAAE